MKQVSAKIEEEQFQWLTAQVRAGRFASISHGIRWTLKKVMEEGEP